MASRPQKKAAKRLGSRPAEVSEIGSRTRRAIAGISRSGLRKVNRIAAARNGDRCRIARIYLNASVWPSTDSNRIRAIYGECPSQSGMEDDDRHRTYLVHNRGDANGFSR